MEITEGNNITTDKGLLPMDWSVKYLKDIIKLKTGNAFSSKHFSNNGPIVITPGNFKLNGGLNFNEKNTVRYSGEYTPTMKFVKGDLLIVMTDLTPDCNLLGKPGIVKTDDPILHNQRIGKIVLTDISVNKDYLYWYFLSDSFSKRMKSTATGSTVRHTSNGSIYNSYIPLPSTKAEQTAIATALSDADALISSLEKLIAKKRNIKQGAMQQLLQPKEGWEKVNFEDLADKNVRWSFTGGPFGSNLKSSDYTGAGVRIIQLQNIGDGNFVNESEVYTSEAKADELISCNIYPGEIILSKMGDPVARACIIPNYHDRYLMCSDGIRLAVDKKKYNPFYVYTYINSPHFRSIAEGSSTGSTRKRIGLKELRGIEISIPSLEIQNKTANILLDMSNEIALLEEKLEKYNLLKHGMMQNLLTGKIRLV